MWKKANRSQSTALQITQVQADERPQYKSIYTEPGRRENEDSLECIGTGDRFLNSSLIVLTLRSAFNKRDLMKLKNFCKANNKKVSHRG